jgi:pimeloyl-ACP methyl ester carboxylesterase
MSSEASSPERPSLHVVEYGSGPTIVATHGLGDQHETFAPLIEPLVASGFRLVLWDLPGHGRSATVPITGPETGIEAMEDVVNRERGRVTLLGHSLGGYLSLSYAAKYPERVDKLVLLSTGPGFRSSKARADWNSYIDRVATKTGLPPGAGAIGHQVDSFVIDSIGALPQPLLHLIGAADDRYSAGAAYIQERAQHARTVPVPDAGHHPQQNHPDLVSRTIIEFLCTPSPARQALHITDVATQ